MLARQTENVNDIAAMAGFAYEGYRMERGEMTAEQEYRQGKLRAAFDTGRMAVFHGDNLERVCRMFESGSAEDREFWRGVAFQVELEDDTADRQAEERDEREDAVNRWRS